MNYKQYYPYQASYTEQNNDTYNLTPVPFQQRQTTPYYMPNTGLPSTGLPSMGYQQGPPTTTNIGYTPAFLKTQIGKRVRIDFLIGTNTFLDKAGTLVEVGIDYVILEEAETRNYILGDLYSIKFVTFYN
jgi:hypothetical protein